MKQHHKRHRLIATFFLLIFFPTLIPANLFASNNGPVAPEATSFEPVDATDMVNLASGDMSYVLPLLNVPSPEGGYPLALSNHAGIAMDQEASWVGLGWSLNPGAINRSVKGVPDDWDKTRVSDLLYDAGETLNYYNFSIGGTLPNGVTLGMSAAWGAHKAWGGVVGFGGITTSYNSDGLYGMGFGAGGFSFNMDSDGGASIGLSYSQSNKEGTSSFGGSLTFDLNSKKVTSGSIGYSSGSKSEQNSVGISFNSNSIGISAGSNGGSITSLQTTASSGDYYHSIMKNGFNFNAGFFWVSYQHTEVSYSLFKLNANYISGTLNLFDSKKESGYVQDGNNYMDVRNHTIFDRNISVHSYDLRSNIDVIFPNYDNYSVTAQGISGSFSPKIYDEVLLYGKGSSEKMNIGNPPTSTENDGDVDFHYLTNPSDLNDSYYKLNNKIFFNFDKINSSFLRTQTGDFKSLDSTIDINDTTFDLIQPENTTGTSIEERFVNNIVTDTDTTFSSPYNKDGQLTKIGNRKRDGNFIEAFTNKEIVDGNTNGQFFEVPGYGREFYKSIAENGIGAYRVTALDGKTYHFSLPVYNFEEVSKNYSNTANENDKFLETVKTKPYATHWLLTAITGPDFIDNNNNNAPDDGDYGYWVKFEYGKWSDGYGWRSPKVGGKINGKNSNYFWGRKEIYYLDKIKTRTHTALFVKSIRNDDKSTSIQYPQTKSAVYQSGAMPSNITQKFEDKLSKPIELGNYYTTSWLYSGYQNINYTNNYSYNQSSFKYVDLPENFTLKLEKIILIKNDDDLNINKNLSVGTNRKKGYSYFDYGFFVPNPYNGGQYHESRKNPYDVKIADINTDQNVLDNNDLATLNQNQGFDLQSKAEKVINFNYDYSLGSNLPNSSQGRLALRSIEFNGKNNTKVIPPYQFNYSKSNTPYNFTNSDDWGYVKDNPDAWSLNEIISPIGTKVRIEYESDSFKKEAAHYTGEDTNYSQYFNVSNLYRPSEPLQYSIVNNLITLTLTSGRLTVDNLNNLFDLNKDIDLKFNFFKISPYNHKGLTNSLTNCYKIIGIDDVNNKLTLQPNERTDLNLTKKFFEGPYCYIDDLGSQFQPTTYSTSIIGADEYAYNFEIINHYNKFITEYGRNGKPGGGIRVSKVTTSDSTNSNNISIEYNYFNPYTNKISGVTSFAPGSGNIQAVEEIPQPNVLYEYVTTSIKNNSELLNRTVYNFKVMDDITLSDPDLGEYEYKFGNMFKIKFFGGSRRDNYSDNNTSKIILYDNFSNLGQLLSVKNYNNNDHLLKTTTNKYKQFQDDSDEQGITQESFKNFERIRDWGRSVNQYGNSFWYLRKKYFFRSVSKTTFPSQLESTSTTQGGYTNTTYYDKYDFLTGQVLETRTISSDGKSFKTKIVPAYTIPEYNPSSGYGMGSKVDNPTNKNMLSQTAAEYSYIWDTSVTSDDKWKETGVGITTWSNVWEYLNLAGTATPATAANEKIWRKHKTYTWNGVVDDNGIFTDFDRITGSGHDGFNWAVPIGVGTPVVQNSKWRQTSEVTLYNHYSASLEIKDINNNFASTKMGDNDSKVITTGNAGYNEMYYSSAEYITSNSSYFDGQIKSNGHIVVGDTGAGSAHTGKSIVRIGQNQNAFEVTLPLNSVRKGIKSKFKVSVWARKGTENNARIKIGNSIQNFNTSETIKAGNWVLLNGYIDILTSATTVSIVSVSGEIDLDDFRLYPMASSITGYVYNEWDELLFIIGNNGLSVCFVYDPAGRLKETYTEVADFNGEGTGGFKPISKNTYHYKN